MFKEEITLVIVECSVGTEHIRCFLNHSRVELTTIILYYYVNVHFAHKQIWIEGSGGEHHNYRKRKERKYVFKKSNYLTERKTEVREIYVNVNIEK